MKDSVTKQCTLLHETYLIAVGDKVLDHPSQGPILVNKLSICCDTIMASSLDHKCYEVSDDKDNRDSLVAEEIM